MCTSLIYILPVEVFMLLFYRFVEIVPRNANKTEMKKKTNKEGK